LTIETGDFIRINYTGRLDDGTIFDTTYEDVAKEKEMYDENTRYGSYVIIVGSEHVVSGMDEDFVGKEAGYNGTVEVPPEKGYGKHKTELVKTFPLSRFNEKPVKGMQVLIEGQPGVVTMTVGRRVRVDFNSQMAGKSLVYDYAIEELIDDDTEKVKSLLNSYFRRDFDVMIVDDGVLIGPPSDLWLNEQWLLAKRRVAYELLHAMELDSVKFVEAYTKESNETEEAEKTTEIDISDETKEDEEL